MTKIEKIKRLKEVLEILKTEFVGLDDIIDEIEKSLTPWYVTPEIIKRPLVISLWGMTGTGKTSLINRLIELLELGNKTFSFDCGEESTSLGKSSIISKLDDFFNADQIDVEDKSIFENLVFVFDEFQHARTISEDGLEINKSDFRPVWSLIDSGILEASVTNWNISNLINFIKDLSDFVETHPGISLENGDTVIDPKAVKELLESLGYFYFNRPIPGVGTKYFDEDVSSDKDPYRPLCLLDWDNKRRIQRYYPGKLEAVTKCNTIEDLLEILQVTKNAILVPKKFDCRRSLIFILGNLDEAFHVERDLNPDISAEVFYDKTSKVSISEIKNALKKRFRAEQIARFGNNLIKYPTLDAPHFKEIISREVSRVVSSFNLENNVNITVSDSFHDLLYSEGVYPVQGVRPVLSTIGNILTPLFSDILIDSEYNGLTEYLITTENTVFNSSYETIKIFSGDEERISKRLELSLGKLRNPKSRKTRFINSVHEAGHAIVMAYLTGKLPTSIVSVSTDGGGFCITYDSDRQGEIERKIDIDNDVMISLGGYVAEKLMFSDELTLMGSNSDFDKAWLVFSNAVYNNGYLTAFKIYNDNILETRDGIPTGLSKKGVEIEATKIFEEFEETVRDILKNNNILLVEMSLYLGENGTMSKDKFKEFIELYGCTLDSNRLEDRLSYLSNDYYETVLRNKR